LSGISSRGGDFSWPPAVTSLGHQWGLSLATSGYFDTATDNLGFRAAVEHLAGPTPGPLRATPKQLSKPAPRASGGRDPQERAVLQAAVSLYHNTLLAEPRALEYLFGRGLDAATVERCRLGYAPGGQLIAYLRWNRLPIGAALHAGLLTRDGAEFLAGRIVVPDLTNGRPAWLIGRWLGDNPPDDATLHLGLPRPKSLLGLDEARSSPTVIVVEGTFDYLTAKMWGYPVVATLGIHLRSDLIEALRGFRRQYLVLDNDDTGLEATQRLQQELGSTAILVALPGGIKDASQLAELPDGRELFAAALLQAVGQPVQDGPTL